MDCQFKDKKWTKTYRLRFKLNVKNYKLIFPFDAIKHFLESSELGSFRLTLNMLIVQLSKFI